MSFEVMLISRIELGEVLKKYEVEDKKTLLHKVNKDSIPKAEETHATWNSEQK